jgi:SAM-dependent methyltransferase
MSTTAHRPGLLPRRTLLAAGLLMPCLARAQERPAPRLDVHYVPTPMPVVNKMLEMAEVKRGNLLYDLGCGDGRIVVTAAKEFGARGIGIDLDPNRIAEAQANAREAGVSDLTRFMVADLFETDFSDADVVTLYLLPELNVRLRPRLWRQLKLGARVVSHDFRMGDWKPERTEHVGNATVYGWTLNERVRKPPASE